MWTFITNCVIHCGSNFDFDVISMSRGSSTGIHINAICVGIQVGFDIHDRIVTTRYDPLTIVVVIVIPVIIECVSRRAHGNDAMADIEENQWRRLSG